MFAFADKNTMVEYNMLDKEYDDFEDLFTEPDEDGTDNEECHEKDGNSLLLAMSIAQECDEVSENRIEWVKKYFFLETFSQVWKSATKGSMRVVYRDVLTSHFETFIDKKLYKWDMLSDGILFVIKNGEEYEFIFNIRNERTKLSKNEYINVLKEMLDLYLNSYYCNKAEKQKWSNLLAQLEQ